MSDFFQNGAIVTLHKLADRKIETIESELEDFCRHRPISLLLPSLYAELEGPALPVIVEQLKSVRYLKQIIVTMGRTSPEEFKKAKQFFNVLPQDVRIIWNDGPNIQGLYQLLNSNDLYPGPDGKGRAVWIAMGYALAREETDIFVLHDCDIVSYNRDLLARLCYPLVNPLMSFDYCKGYYSRVTDRMHGRVTRLFITPMIRSLKKIFGHHHFLEFIDSFRYPLAGEFGFTTGLARRVRIPSDWGLEMGMLSEIYRNCAVRQICQVELTDKYEHKHQPLSETDPTKGLVKMSGDIIKSLLRTLAGFGLEFSPGSFRTLKATYLRTAQDFVERYAHDAAINGLLFDRHLEEVTIDVFMKCIIQAGREFLENPFETPHIPNWNRITSAIPDFYRQLVDAVEEDNKK